MMKRTIRFILVANLILALLVSNSWATGASFTDGESSVGNVLQAWLPSMWVQTTQADFEAGVLNNVDTATSSGDVILASVSNWYDVNWSYRRTITIDHNDVQDVADPSSTYADFPVLVYATGLSNINANGTDIRFTSSDGTTELPREIESYSSGTLYAWVKVTLTKDSSDSSDDVIYMYYGNASATEPPSDSTYGAENVWDSNHLGVWHLNETVTDEQTTGIHYDSTSNDYDGSQNNNDDAGGKMANGQNFDGNDYVNVAALSAPTDKTFSLWIYPDSLTADFHTLIEFGNDAPWFGLALWSGQWYLLEYDTDCWGETSLPAGQWYHVVYTSDSTAGGGKIYLNGTDITEFPSSASIETGSGMGIAYHADDPYFNGIIDEVRISNVARSAEWIKTEYNNQNSPNSFCGVGIEMSNFTFGTLASQVFDSGAAGSWYDFNWNYRRPVTLSPATSVDNYQVLVTLTTAVMGNPYTGVNADGSDIRFTGADETTQQDYWIESWDNTGTSKIWVEVQVSGTSTIYMYYGNVAASSTSDGDAVFDFFDDFGDGDISDWFQYGSGTVQVANDVGNYVLLKTLRNDPNGGYSLFNNGELSDFEVVFRTKRINETGGAQNRYGIECSSFDGYGPRMADFNSLPAVFAIERRASGSGSNLVSKSTSTYQWNTWMTVKFRKYGSTLEFELYNSSGSLVESITTTNSLYNNFDRFSVHGGWEFYTDDIIVRKYVSTEPVTSVGSQESADTTIWTGLVWDETLQSNTDITFEVRASDTPFAKDASSPSWVAVGGTSPVVTGLPSGRYIQWRAILTTSDPYNTPTLHEIIVCYE